MAGMTGMGLWATGNNEILVDSCATTKPTEKHNTKMAYLESM